MFWHPDVRPGNRDNSEREQPHPIWVRLFGISSWKEKTVQAWEYRILKSWVQVYALVEELPMRHCIILLAAFSILLPVSSSVFAEGADVEWDILNDEVKELYRTGKYGRAVVVAKKALEVAEENVGPYHSSVATSLNNLALLYDTQGH